MKLVRAKEGYRKVEDKWLIAKKCSKCGRWLVASTVNFHRNKGRKYGLSSECKKCANNRNKQWREANKEKLAEYQKQYREANKEKRAECQKRWCENNKEKIAEYGKQYRENNKEKLAEQRKQYYQDNKEKIVEQRKQWYEDNKEKLIEQRKQYYQDNKEKLAEHNKQYRQANKEKIAKQRKQYYENNKEKIAERRKQYYQANKEKEAERKKRYNQTLQGKIVLFNKAQRRRAKQQQQGSGITKDQWLEMMKFFDFRCAYSGERLSKKTRSVDHIVPLNSGGDNMIWNMVPMKLNYNSSKQEKDILEWYREQSFYSEARLQKIYQWQEYAYNKWGKDSEYFNSGNIQITLL